MKSEKEHWTPEETIATFADTPHEKHSIMTGFVAGLSEGSNYKCDEKYIDEEHYYSLGWGIGEIVDRIMNNNPNDTKMALAQFFGIVIKYAIIAILTMAGYNILC